MNKILYVALLLAAFSCKKKEDSGDPNNVTPSRESLIGTYRITAETTNGQNTWNSANHPSCDLDDHYELKTDGTVTITEESIICVTGGGTVTGSWAINGSTFTLNGVDATVQSFTNGVLVVRRTVSVSGGSATRIVTYSRI